MANVLSLASHTSMCLVQKFEGIESNGQPIVNEYDCPLLTLTDTITGVYPVNIVIETSIVHECTDSCDFVDDGPLNVLQVERETIQTNRLAYMHDWTNKLYCFNIIILHDAVAF